jgi:hypothetical protein
MFPSDQTIIQWTEINTEDYKIWFYGFIQYFLYNIFIYLLADVFVLAIWVQFCNLCIDFCSLDNGLIRSKHVMVMTEF